MSLSRRLLWTALVVLAVFLGGAAWVLDQAFRESARATAEQRLRNQFYLLLADAEIDDQARLVMPHVLREPLFSSPASGVYAKVLDETGTEHWRSPSLIVKHIPFVQTAEIGKGRFSALRDAQGKPYFGYAYGVSWEGRQLFFQVTETAEMFQGQVNRFRTNLWWAFAGLSLLLLLLQWLILRWGLRPMRHVARDLEQVRSGQAQRLRSDYPDELALLTESINQFIRSERAQQERYRNALDDLAHSLKTPLAVIRAQVDTPAGAETAQVLREQTARMREIVDYQLQRAQTAAHRTLTEAVALAPLIERLCTSLDKVYLEKGVSCERFLPGNLTCQMDEGDLMEMIGNVLDNAYKYCKGRVRVLADETDRGVVVTVEDDGEGIAPNQVELVLRRGKRADTREEGQGIGLAVVAEILAAYDGKLEIDRSRWGGARVRLSLLH